MTLRSPYEKPVYAEKPKKQSQGLIVAILFIGMACIAFLSHTGLVATVGPFGIIWLVVLSVVSIVVSYEFTYAFLMVTLFMQNAFIAIVSPMIREPAAYEVLLASSVITIVLMAMLSVAAWLKWRGPVFRDNRKLLTWLALFMASVGFYGIIGAIASSPQSAIIYVRIYIIGVLMVVIGGALGLRLTLDYAVNVVRVIGIILVIWGIAEFFFTYELYSLFNIKDYLNLKFTNIEFSQTFSNLDELISSYTRSYLNLSGQFGINFSIFRLQGPNIHSISYSYALTFCCLICFMSRYYFTSIGCFLIALLVGAKGPLLLIVTAVGLCFLYERSKSTKIMLTALVSLMIGYVTLGVIYGIMSSDYHVLGLIGGLNGFIHNPLGHGIGVGGSMSSMGLKDADFQLFQREGAADFATESAIGVMLYQFGIATGVFLMFYWQLWKSVWKTAMYFSSDMRLVVIPIVLAMLFVNGVFQEEVFSPLGWGPWLLFSGVLLGNRWQRMGIVYRATNPVDAMYDAAFSRKA